ncbi:hypothetical protein OESDEN_25410 [Oesophagostomum dentatum]|uniref:Uncharacterized protein n=1 Tax=Oesophagostomum dentatum TaxID=61180 RepID=A0A0B1RQR5_OESDE|nr:hypothetical protein OESDEN_25410 [Oesophagostomum dentatum]
MGQQLSTIAATPSSRVLQIYNELEKTRIERELAMQELLEHRRRAYQLAYEREKLKWSASGGGIMIVFCVFSWLHHK